MNIDHLKYRFYHILSSRAVSKFIYGLIVLNVICLVLETNKGIRRNFIVIFSILEYCSIAIFSVEFFIRIFTSDLDKNCTTIFRSKKLGYLFSTYGLIDFIAIIPFYLPLVFPVDLRIIRILRLFRLFRILKLGRYSKSFKTIRNVLKETKPQLVVTVSVATILLVLSSTLMFYAENEAQPDKFESISDSLWWAVATLTTVGYGDVYPVTSMGKILSAVIALIGIGFIALPTGILSSAFIENLQKAKPNHKCIHCGKKA